MPTEKSAGAVVFRHSKNKTEYLLLHYGVGHWDFPKGHIEKGESEEEALRREVFEETGIKDLRIIPGFSHTMKYFFKKYITTPSGKIKRGKEMVMKFVVFYLAETKTKKVKLSLYFLDQQQKFSTVRTKIELEEAQKEILEWKKKIEKSDFTCSGNYLCRDCEYKLMCSSSEM